MDQITLNRPLQYKRNNYNSLKGYWLHADDGKHRKS